ncbi:MAG: hypothetical protein BroJett011_03960 [Chloroflexota bacterium]|nr:MAG: hypothetical protein BroJett011_03960 [Chloroflexota bacterium]
MAFTYDETLATDRDKVRFRTGDTQQTAGPRPDKRNFSDAEIAAVLDDEDDRVNGAIASIFETLASEWTAWALVDKEGEAQIDAKEVAKGYREQAKIWRAKPGGSSEAGRSGSIVKMTRKDAYSG